MKFLFLAFSFSLILSTAQAKPAPNTDYDEQNEKIGLETKPTAARIKDAEMVLGAIYSIEDQITMNPGAEELANRKGQGNGSRKSNSKTSK